MTARTDYTLPYDREKVLSGDPEQLDKALYEIVKAIEDNQQKNAREINGDIRANYSEAGVKWTPLLKEGGAATTFTYVHQIGFVLRKGLMVDAWFDISWRTASAALTSYLYVELPYLVTRSTEKPFVGIIQSSNLTYTVGTECVINGLQNSREGQIWNVGDGIATSQQDAVTSGQLIGHIRYIGQQNE